MTELEVALTAAAVVLLAAVAPAVPVWLGVTLLVLAVVARHPLVLALGLALLAGGRAHDALDALAPPRPHAVRHAAVLVVSDPELRFGRWQVEVRREERGRVERDLADLPRTAPVPVVGQRLVVAGRVRAMTASGWSTARHLRARFAVTDVVRVEEPAPWFRLANAVRATIVGGATSVGERRPLFAGLVLGDDREQPAAQVEAFRVAGLAHLLAVSGQNVAFVLLVAAPVVTRVPGRVRWLAIAVVLALFVLVTRWEPSVLRAVAMAGVVAIARARGRSASPRRSLAVAVIVLLVLDPLLVRSTGFQLSVAACVALTGLAPGLGRRLGGPRWWRDLLAPTIAAHVGTLPLLLASGAQVSAATIAANLVAVPAAGAVMVWGLTGGALAGVAPPPVAAALHLPTRVLLWWIEGAADIGASSVWPRLTAPVALLAVGALAGWWIGRRRLAVLATVVALCLLGAAAVAPAVSGRCPGVRVASAGSAVVVAVLPVATESAVLRCLTAHGVDTVDLLVLAGGGSTTTRQADAVRLRHAVRAVWAPPQLVRDAVVLRPGRWRVGDVSVVVGRRRGGWTVEVG